MRFDTYMFSVTVNILNKFKMTFVQQLLLVYLILLCVCIDLFMRYMKELVTTTIYYTMLYRMSSILPVLVSSLQMHADSRNDLHHEFRQSIASPSSRVDPVPHSTSRQNSIFNPK